MSVKEMPKFSPEDRVLDREMAEQILQTHADRMDGWEICEEFNTDHGLEDKVVGFSLYVGGEDMLSVYLVPCFGDWVAIFEGGVIGNRTFNDIIDAVVAVEKFGETGEED